MAMFQDDFPTQAATDAAASWHATVAESVFQLCESSTAPPMLYPTQPALAANVAEQSILDSLLPLEVGTSFPCDVQAGNPMAASPLKRVAPHSLDSNPVTPLKRRRLSQKQSAMHVMPVVSSPSSTESSLSPIADDMVPTCVNDQPIHSAQSLSPEDRDKYKSFHKSFTKWLKKASVLPTWEWTSKLQTWARVAEAGIDVQVAILRKWGEEAKIAPETFEWAMVWAQEGQWEAKAVKRARESAMREVRKKSLVLTYQGRFGVFPASFGVVPSRSAAEEAIRGTSGLAKDLLHGNVDVIRCIEEVCAKIRDAPQFLVLRADVERHVEYLEAEFFVDEWAWSLELCIKSFFEAGVVRVHLHVFLFKDSGCIRTKSLSKWSFSHCLPDVASLTGARQKTTTAYSGLFYVSGKGKYGSIACAATKVAHKDYVVQPQWVLNLMGMGKMSPLAAREHLVMQGRDLPRLLSSMDRYVQERRNMALEEHQASVLAQLHAMARPFIHIPCVEAWVKSHKELRWRYLFLVLVGSSMLGKTRYALSLVPKGRSLELNCVSGNEPDLRTYDATQIDLLLLDEMPASGVLKQKKLMQCPPALIQLGTSATNAFSYKVWVHQKLMVVSSNTWFEELEELAEGDRDWLCSNSVVVQVNEPLWLPSPVVV